MNSSIALASPNILRRIAQHQQQHENDSNTNIKSSLSNIILLCNKPSILPKPTTTTTKSEEEKECNLIYTILEMHSISSATFDNSTSILDTDDTNTNTILNEKEKELVDEIVIHPILSEVLVLSCDNTSTPISFPSSSLESDLNNDVEIEASNTHDTFSIPVTLQCNHSYNDTYNDVDTILSAPFYIQPIEEMRDYLTITENNHNSPRIELHIQHWSVNEDKDETSHNNRKEEQLKAVSNGLEGRIVGIGCTLVLHIPPTLESCYDEDDTYVIVRILEIHSIQEDCVDGTSNATGNGMECYRLGLSDSFSVISRNESSDTNTNNTDRTTVNEEEKKESGRDTMAMAGYESQFLELCNLSLLSLNNNNNGHKVSAAAPSGVLVTGISGIGKTFLVQKVMNEIQSTVSNCVIHSISCHGVLLAASSSSASMNTSMEDDLIYNTILPSALSSNRPIVVVLDDMHILYSSTDEDEEEYDVDQSIAKNAIFKSVQILQQLSPRRYLFIGICQTPSSQSLQKDIYKIHFFEKIVHLSIPTQYQREVFLRYIIGTQMGLSSLLEEDQYVKVIAAHTPGYIVCDLRRICINAWINATFRNKRTPTPSASFSDTDDLEVITSIQSILAQSTDTTNENDGITWDDILQATKKCIPFQLSNTIDVVSPQHTQTQAANQLVQLSEEEQFYRICKETNFGGYKPLKHRIYRSIIQPWKRYLSFQYQQQQQSSSSTKSKRSLMIAPPTGIIIHGPSGVGKTALASILSQSLNFQIIQIKTSDILNKWQGGSERNIRDLFLRARSASPCILFFDDIDSFTSSRMDFDADGDAGDNVYSRILSTLLNEMDGISSCAGGAKEDVLIVATTNRLHAVDSALLRPGRFEEHVPIIYPTVEDCLDIMDMYTDKIKLQGGVDFVALVDTLVGCGVSGADMEGICREACFCAMRRLEAFENEEEEDLLVEHVDFEEAIQTVLSI